MTSKFTKGIFLGLLLVLCMSVAVAADVSDDAALDDVQVTDSVSDVESDVTDTDNSECSCVTTTDTVPITPANTSFTAETNTKYDFSGNFVNKSYTFDNINNVVFTSSAKDAIFYNTTFTINGQNVCINNFKFENTETSGTPLTVTGSNICICQNTFNVTKTSQEETYSINVINSDNIRVKNNFINETGVPQMMGWDTGVGVIKFSGIVFDNVTSSVINNNELYIQNCSEAYPFGFSTMEAITVKGGSQDTNISSNNITITGSEYIYAISLSEFDNNILVEENNVYLDGSNYVCGIQLSSTTNSTVRKNKIYGNCTSTSGSGASGEAFAYGVAVLTGTWGASSSEATGNIVCNNSVSLNSTIAYAIELSNVDNTVVCNNNANVTGNVVMALGIYNSTNCNITGNIFNVTGNTTTLSDSIYEAVYPVTTGIKIVDNDSNNINITNNTITVTENTNITTFAILFEDNSGNYVTNNTLRSYYGTNGNKSGDGAVDGLRNYVQNNN